MIITDKFVFIHFPKTGGLFATDMLRKVHQRKPWWHFFTQPPAYQELMLPNLKKKYAGHRQDPHGTYDQIPEEPRRKVIISTIRNPLDRYVSTYEFRAWTRRDPAEMESILRDYPEFPDLTFERYVKFANVFDIAHRAHSSRLKLDIGLITYTFIQFFFQDPGRIIENLDEDYFQSDACGKDMPSITFLHSEALNRELFDFLLSMGYRKKNIAYILDAQRQNVTAARKEKKWKDYYSRELFDFVKFKERFIFRLFPEYNVDF